MKKSVLKISALASLLMAVMLFFGACNCGGILEKVKYKINFEIGGSVYDTIETGGNENITLPLPPIEEDYTFEGWYYDSAYNSKVSFPLSVTRAMTLYAE